MSAGSCSSPGFSKRSAAPVKVLVPVRTMLEKKDCLHNIAKQKTSHDIHCRWVTLRTYETVTHAHHVGAPAALLSRLCGSQVPTRPLRSDQLHATCQRCVGGDVAAPQRAGSWDDAYHRQTIAIKTKHKNTVQCPARDRTALGGRGDWSAMISTPRPSIGMGELSFHPNSIV